MNKFLGERGLDLAGLEHPVRRVIFTAYAVLIGLALSVALRGFFAQPAVLADPGIRIPAAVAIIAAITACIALAMLIAGAAHAKSRWRYLILLPALATVTICDIAVPFERMLKIPLAAAITFYAAPFLLLAGCVVVAARAPRMRMARVVAAVICLVAVFALGVVGLSWLYAPTFAPTALLIGLFAASQFLEPALLVVGFDLAEIAAAGAEVANKRLPAEGKPFSRLLRAGVIVGGLLVALGLQWGLGYGLTGPHLYITLIWAIVLAAVGAVFVFVGRRRPPAEHAGHAGHAGHEALDYRSVLLAAIAVYLIGLAGSYFTELDGRYYNYAGAHPFSIRVPEGMKLGAPALPADPNDELSPVRASFQSAGHRPPTVSIFGIERLATKVVQPTTVNELIAIRGSAQMPIAEAPKDSDGWRRGMGVMPAKGQPFRFVVLEYEVDSTMPATAMNWFIVCGDRQDKFETLSKTCEHVRGSFAGDNRWRSARGPAAIMDVLLACACAAMLVVAATRRRRGPTPLSDLIFWALALSALIAMVGYLWGGVDTPLMDLKLFAQLLAAVLVVTALAAAVLELVPANRVKAFDLAEARKTAIGSVTALGAIAGVLFLYVFAANSSENSQAIRGVVVCLVLTWELASAGMTLNPAEAEHEVFPRSSRVLIFVAYLMMVATCVLLFSGGAIIWTGQILGSWDTESVVARGLVTLGAALILSRATAVLSARQ